MDCPDDTRLCPSPCRRTFCGVHKALGDLAPIIPQVPSLRGREGNQPVTRDSYDAKIQPVVIAYVPSCGHGGTPYQEYGPVFSFRKPRPCNPLAPCTVGTSGGRDCQSRTRRYPMEVFGDCHQGKGAKDQHPSSPQGCRGSSVPLLAERKIRKRFTAGFPAEPCAPYRVRRSSRDRAYRPRRICPDGCAPRRPWSGPPVPPQPSHQNDPLWGVGHGDRGGAPPSFPGQHLDLCQGVHRSASWCRSSVACLGGPVMSALRDALAAYISLRRALGTRLKEPAETLGQFVDFIEKEGATFITTERAIRWATQHDWVQHNTWARRLSMVRGFASWLSTSDPRTEIPPKGAIRLRAYAPAVSTSTPTTKPEGSWPRLPGCVHAPACVHGPIRRFFGLLASTGLRPGEALALNCADVDLIDAILTVRQTKFGKSRLVPLDASTCTLFPVTRKSVTAAALSQGAMLSSFGAWSCASCRLLSAEVTHSSASSQHVGSAPG